MSEFQNYIPERYHTPHTFIPHICCASCRASCRQSTLPQCERVGHLSEKDCSLHYFTPALFWFQNSFWRSWCFYDSRFSSFQFLRWWFEPKSIPSSIWSFSIFVLISAAGAERCKLFWPQSSGVIFIWFWNTLKYAVISFMIYTNKQHYKLKDLWFLFCSFKYLQWEGRTGQGEEKCFVTKILYVWHTGLSKKD